MPKDEWVLQRKMLKNKTLKLDQKMWELTL